MPSPAVYFITGANRGIGLALVAEILSSANSAAKDVHVFAGARSPSSAKALQELQSRYPGKLSIVPFVAADEENNKAAAKIVQENFGWVDIVVGNAGKTIALSFANRIMLIFLIGINDYMGTVEETPAEQMNNHLIASLPI
jgi:NAD(P)-dependent dehydrogenase (short-subunit alcohol dehydrogenase family)